MGRKNKRNKKCYERPLGFNPNKYLTKRSGRGRHVSQNKYPRENTSCMNRNPRHYEVWFAELGFHPGTSVQDGCRPVVIISNDHANTYASTVTVIPMTSRQKRMDMASHAWLEGISEEIPKGMLLAEQITTIPKSALIRCAGRIVETEHIEKLERAVRSQLDMCSHADDGE